MLSRFVCLYICLENKLIENFYDLHLQKMKMKMKESTQKEKLLRYNELSHSIIYFRWDMWEIWIFLYASLQWVLGGKYINEENKTWILDPCHVPDFPLFIRENNRPHGKFFYYLKYVVKPSQGDKITLLNLLRITHNLSVRDIVISEGARILIFCQFKY